MYIACQFRRVCSFILSPLLLDYTYEYILPVVNCIRDQYYKFESKFHILEVNEIGTYKFTFLQQPGLVPYLHMSLQNCILAYFSFRYLVSINFGAANDLESLIQKFLRKCSYPNKFTHSLCLILLSAFLGSNYIFYLIKCITILYKKYINH